MLIASYAKINLYLNVVSKRIDGYHEVDTVLCSVNLADSLRFALTKKPQIQILATIPELSAPSNLICKTAERIGKDFGFTPGLRIHLTKRIPLSAGLGGGSSNAAMTILAMKALYQLPMSEEYMHSLAASLGSDINFFLVGGTAQGSERGEIITPLPDAKPMELLLVNPGIGVSSGEAYKLIDWDVPPYNGEKMWFNKLESGVRKRYPVIDNLLNDLREQGADEAMLSGSGATCIGWFQDKTAEKNAMRYFRDMGYWTKQVKTLGRSDYQRCIQSLS